MVRKIRSQDTDVTRRLVGALRRREIEMRERLTPRNTMEWLEWMYSPGMRDWSHPLGFGLFDMSEEVFSNSCHAYAMLKVAIKVYYWVLNTILCIDFEDRMDWYRYFLRLAEVGSSFWMCFPSCAHHFRGASSVRKIRTMLACAASCKHLSTLIV